MKKKIICLISIFIIAFSPVLSVEKTIEQQITDLEKKLQQVSGKEKIEVLNDIAYKMYSISPEKCIEYGSQALSLSREYGYPIGKARALKVIGIGYSMSGNRGKALEYLQKSLKTYEKIGDKKEIAGTLKRIGIVHDRLFNYNKALEYYFKSLAICEEIMDKPELASNLNNIGLVYYFLSDYAKSLEYYYKTLKIYEETGDKVSTADTLGNIGIVYQDLEDYEKALEIQLKTLKIREEIGRHDGIAITLGNIGLIYEKLGDYHKALDFQLRSLELKGKGTDKYRIANAFANIGNIYGKLKDDTRSLQYLKNALRLYEKIRDKNGAAMTLSDIGYIYSSQQKYREALSYYEQGLKIAKEINSKYIVGGIYKNISDMYASKKDFKKAYQYHLLFQQTDKEILNEKSTQQLNRLNARYEAEKRTEEIEMLKKNNEIQQLKLSREGITRYALIIGLILVLIISGLVFKKYLYLLAFWKKQKYIGRFRLMDKIASGGMGTIFKAHSIHDKSDFAAVKVLRDELFSDTTNKKRFKREAAIIDKLEHPNIIKIFERGESKQTLFIAMEYLEGKTLEHKINEEGPLPLQESLDIMVQIASALVFIHGKNIIHRDLKPANIMLIEKDGNPNFVKLLDFGLARMELETRLTQSGNLIGTLQYLAPEQVLDAHSATTNDVFSLGVTYYYLLSGENPFTGETAVDIMRQIIIKEPVRISKLRPGIPGELDELVMQMMNKEPGERPSAKSIQDKLQYLKKK